MMTATEYWRDLESRFQTLHRADISCSLLNRLSGPSNLALIHKPCRVQFVEQSFRKRCVVLR